MKKYKNNVLSLNGEEYKYTNIKDIVSEKEFNSLPKSLKVLLENVARFKNEGDSANDIDQIIKSVKSYEVKEIAYRPARVLMQDFTGVPSIVDLAAMRDAMIKRGGDADKINPQIPVDLVVDHSVSIDHWNSADSYDKNVEHEYMRNSERYSFLKWAQKSFKNFRVVPPGAGICHQVNLEYLGKVAWVNECEITGEKTIYPDTLVGTDSHTTMINALSVLGWGVGGIEAEAAMLGQPISMLIPEVIGFKLEGSLKEGVTATDLVLTITNILRSKGVVGKFVEFYGDGLSNLPLADRATISNMSPEFGSTCAFFPVDDQTLKYLKLSGRDDSHISLVEHYAKLQGLWRNEGEEMEFNDTVSLNLNNVEPLLAGPKRPQDKVYLSDVKNIIDRSPHERSEKNPVVSGDIVIAAITSCTNTSNPSVMIGAGLIAKRAADLGIVAKDWVKCSLAPGSKVVTEYLEKANVLKSLENIGFYLVGYGCTTCIGNSGPLHENISKCIEDNNLNVASVLSGNRNFEGRIHPLVKSSFLASPMLVVAYALAGTTNIDLESYVFGNDKEGNEIKLKDLWPSSSQIQECVSMAVQPNMFKEKYSNIFEGEKRWADLKVTDEKAYEWNDESTYVQNPPYFNEKSLNIADIKGAKILALLGDSITTDHISPAGSIKHDSTAGEYLKKNNVEISDFNSYGSRRGNHHVMIRGTFANIRMQNKMTPEKQGGWSRLSKIDEPTPLYDVANHYISNNIPSVIIAGKEYGTGSSRDWAAKGTMLLGIKAVIAESFERIHRSNLVGMGVLPFQFENGDNAENLNLTGFERINITGISNDIKPGLIASCEIVYEDETFKNISLKLRVDTEDEIKYMKSGGILPFVLDNLAA